MLIFEKIVGHTLISHGAQVTLGGIMFLESFHLAWHLRWRLLDIRAIVYIDDGIVAAKSENRV